MSQPASTLTAQPSLSFDLASPGPGMIAFNNPFAPRTQNLAGPAANSPDMNSVFGASFNTPTLSPAPSFAGAQVPGTTNTLLAASDSSSSSNSASNPAINSSEQVSLGGASVTVTSSSMPNSMSHASSISSATGRSENGSMVSTADGLLPTDLTHSANVMAGRRVSVATTGVSSGGLDPGSLVDPTNHANDSYTHLPFVNHMINDESLHSSATMLPVSTSSMLPVSTSVIPEMGQAVAGSTNTSSTGMNINLDARRMSMPVLSMTNKRNADGSIPLHARRKGSLSMDWRSASENERPNDQISLGSSDNMAQSTDRSSSSVSATGSSVSDAPVLSDQIFGPSSTMASLDKARQQAAFQTQSSLNVRRMTFGQDSESDEDSLPCEIVPLPILNSSKSCSGTINDSRSSSTSAPTGALMTTFNSKISVGTQKKHKCPICHKRFTRPSSLQTHIYSHTGEKPYYCDHKGCGRQFSVVSNLRRHKKIHASPQK
ncbi:hypothetical protein V1511DRAFT_462834 [Dipodascopsis uninucleata]